MLAISNPAVAVLFPCCSRFELERPNRVPSGPFDVVAEPVLDHVAVEFGERGVVRHCEAARPNRAVVADRSRSLSSVIRWPYTSNVIDGLACPNAFDNAGNGTPAEIAVEA